LKIQPPKYFGPDSETSESIIEKNKEYEIKDLKI
jgi:hypothetical protein